LGCEKAVNDDIAAINQQDVIAVIRQKKLTLAAPEVQWAVNFA
jgi:hypothetical protein